MLGTLIREVMARTKPKKYWRKSTIIDFIKGCRNDLGIPLFQRVKSNGYNTTIIAECWGGNNTFPNVQIFEDVKPEDMGLNWTELVEKYGSEKDKEELLRKPIRVKIKGNIFEINHGESL